MPIDERARHVLHRRLEHVLGQDEAATLMSYLSPVGWADVATKRDLDQLADRLRAELHEQLGGVRTELQAQVGELREQLGGVRTELQAQIGELHEQLGGVRTELQAQVGELREQLGGVRTELQAQIGELHEQVGGVRAEVHEQVGGVRADLGRQTRFLFLSLLGSNATLVGLAFAAARLT